MMKITPEDLIRFLYHETSDTKTARIKEALQIDPDVRDEFEKIKNTHSKLEEANFSPSQESIDKILEYASKKQKQLHSI